MARSRSRTRQSSPDGRPSLISAEFDRDAALQTFNNAQPRPWHGEVVTISRKVIAQIFGKNPFRTSYFTLFRPIHGFRDVSTLVAAVILAIAAGLPLPIIGIIFGKIINSFPPPEHELVIRLGQLLGVGAAYFLVTAGYTIAWGLTGERISRQFRQTLVERLLGLDQAYFDVQDPDVTNLLTEKIEAIQIGTSEKVGIFIQSISYFVAAFVVGFILNAKLTGILFAAVIPLMTIIVVAGSHTVSKYSKQASKYAEQANKLAESAISAVKVVQAFGMSNTLGDEHYRLLRLSAAYAFRKSAGAAVMLGAVYFTAYAANGLAFYVGSRIAAESGGSEAGTVYAVVFLILDASFVVGQFGPFLGAFASAAAAGEKVTDVLDQDVPEIDIYATHGESVKAEVMQMDIRFRNASFVYPSRDTTPAMDNLTLTLQGRKMNAIVGMSGSGKSTLVSLLLRLYDVSSGQLLIGDQDIKSFNVGKMRQHVALVDQDSILFSGSILENISYGLDSKILTDEEILSRCKQAAKDANCNFLEQLPEGIHSLVGQSGSTQLSGGQRQRICLARALVRKPSLLLLDEPTSALDSRSEALVMDAVKRAAASGCTIVMVTHRLSTVTDFDNIALMANAKVLEQGSHSELMSQDGAYQSMINAQGIGQGLETSSTASGAQTPTLETSESDIAPKNEPATERKPEDDKAEQKKLGLHNVLGRISRLNKENWPLVFLGLILSIVSGGIILGEAIIFGHLIQLLSTGINSDNYLGRADLFCLLFLILAIVAFFSYSGSGTSFGVVSARFIAKIQHISLDTILRQDIEWFSGQSVSSLMTSLQSDAGQLSCLSGVAVGTIFTVTTSVTGGIILAHVVAWKIAIVLLSAVPVMIAAGYVRLRVLALSETRHRSAYNEAASIAAEACRSIRTIASLGRERGVAETYKAALEQPYRQGLRFTLISNTLLALSLSITYFVYALAYWWGAQQVRSGDYTVLEFFIVLPALLFSAQSAGQLFSLSPEISRAGVAARNVFSLHDQQPTIMDHSPSNKASELKSDSISTLSSTESEKRLEKSAGCQGQIELESVSLTYESKPNHPALNGISLKILPGEFAALVGPSGAGKSSMVSLLERFYDPTTGRLLVDGEDIRLMPVTAHRARIGLVPQDPDLFPGSISYNIQLGAAPGQRITDDEVQSICKKCKIHDFIASLPEGYNTECGTNGSKLSGGQKQRVAIARALVRNPEILLLDEYTSALDAHSEQEIKDALAGASEGRTTIVVAHRLSTVQGADKIYVFDQGRVAETGTHAELAALGGLYTTMVKAQTLA